MNMKRGRFYLLLTLVSWVIGSGVHAIDPSSATENTVDLSAQPEYSNWLFSGLVNNENGETFAYIFSIQQTGHVFHVQTALFDGEKNKLLFSYDQRKTLNNTKELKLKVGHAFLNYNPINASWSFGVRLEKRKGFHFKVDMLSSSKNKSNAEALRPGLQLLVKQANRLNGYIQLGAHKEQFVTANYSWFSQIWLTTTELSSHAVCGVFCHLKDFSGFYALKLDEQDANHAALAGWRNAEGNDGKISQFVEVKRQKNDRWSVDVTIPKFSIEFNDLLADVISMEKDGAGFFHQARKGFCWVTEQPLGGGLLP
ncbi:hypothetical protein E3983_04765 [Legionella israelensis]|uniref:AttH domain-containing protein n=1 Tax=Legionella israelensis TaxID=454 RepID=A0AAX1EF55_9GAMM|nr:hypothetical protein [Legionella israelensis]QBR83726.1 hypothetical protein E3983_04765 [Legionella israelensis]